MAAADTLSLRERKYARTKLALLDAALERLEDTPWEELSVRELCRAALVSEATFFNYFARKSELLEYFLQLWTLETAWHGKQAGDSASGLEVIGAVFKRAAATIEQRPGLMGELIAHQASLRQKPRAPQISRAERLLAFPELEGIEHVQATGLDSVLVPNLQRAIRNGELPDNTHIPSVMVALVAIFYGVPLALRLSSPQGIGSMYTHQLNTLWAGVRASAQRPPPGNP